MNKSILFFVNKNAGINGIQLPFCSSKIRAGFPSPADDYQEGTLSLDELLIKHPAATFFVKVAGNSMVGAGIFPDDILIVDRSLPVNSGKIVVALVDGEFTVKRYILKGGKVYLVPENPDYQVIKLGSGSEANIWGVVTTVLHSV